MRDGAPLRPSGAAPGLARGFGLLVVATTGLIVLGALVRAHEAGLACPDWPFCFGEVVPEFDLRVGFEWSHRAFAGTISIVFACLAIATLRHPAGTPARPLLAVAAALLALQVLLGALTVWQLLAAWTVTSHLVVGNAFNVSLLLVALTLRGPRAGREPSTPAPRAARDLLFVAAGLLAAQVVLGGLVSSTFAGMACPEWPTCNGGTWFPAWDGSVGLHLLHRMNGYALLLALAVAAYSARGLPRVGVLSAAAFLLGALQVVVGVSNVLLGIPVEVTGLHSLLAALLILTIAATLHAALERKVGDARV
jgi:cytochrome c oxidase assembly protein subunit 15